MAISEVDAKILWAKAGGRCSYPECNIDLIPLLEESGNVILGEMAHIIAHRPDGPRGQAGDRENIDQYPNLILLCPTHHTMIDKGSKDFPPASLRSWKSLHENRISQAMEDLPSFHSTIDLYRYTCRLLGENGIVHQRYGPTSLAARHDIFGEAADVWKFRKLSTLVPNNNRIVRAFVANQGMVSDEVWRAFLEFQEHARGFEANSYRRLDGHLVPRFPKSFEALLEEIINGASRRGE
jgi:hypothetical protein